LNVFLVNVEKEPRAKNQYKSQELKCEENNEIGFSINRKNGFCRKLKIRKKQKYRTKITT